MSFIVEDEAHAEVQGEFASLQEAVAELARRAAEPWDSELNRPPCQSWRTCSRRYEIIEQDGGQEISRIAVLEISASGTRWLTSAQNAGPSPGA